MILFGYEISLRGLLTLDFPPAMGRGWYTLDVWSIVAAIGLVPAVYILYKVEKHLFTLIKSANPDWEKKMI